MAGNVIIREKLGTMLLIFLSKIFINFNVFSLNICGILSICDRIHYWSKVEIIRILIIMNDFWRTEVMMQEIELHE